MPAPKTDDTKTDDTPIDAAALESWALTPENKARAKALGLRLIGASNKTADELRAMDSLGDFEDRAQEWAIANKNEARMLIFKLISKLA